MITGFGVDFGTYHHSTPKESEKTRERLHVLFRESFRNVSEIANGDLKVLDSGSGLGFLSYLVCSTFPHARVFGIDSYEDDSLFGSSMERVQCNMEKLGYANRVEFVKADLRDLPFGNDTFDLAVTSLVYHNIIENREKAYSELFRVLKSGGYLFFGDIFFDKDVKKFRDRFDKINGYKISGAQMPEYNLLVLKKP